MLFPSEHVYLSNTATLLLLPSVKKVVARLVSADLGSNAHCCPYARSDPNRSASLYSGRKYDKELAGEFLKLQNRLSNMGKHGKLRLNVVHVTAMAFALRHHREEQSGKESEVELLEQRLENLRKRLKWSARRKDDGCAYAQFKNRWDSFAQWMNFSVLYDRKHPPRPLPDKTLRIVHRHFLVEVKGWLHDLIRERCDNEISDAELLQLAYRVKRRARQRRFGRQGRRVGEKLRVMLDDKESFSDEVFVYIQNHVNLSLKFEYLHSLFQRSIQAEKACAEANVGRGPGIVPITRTQSAPILSSDAIITVCSKDSEPVLAVSEYPKQKFIRLIGDFFLEEVDPYFWYDTEMDARHFPFRHIRNHYPEPGCMEPKDMRAWSRPDWNPENGPEWANWYVEYLLGWLRCYVHFSQIPDLVAAGCKLAREGAGGNYVAKFRSIAYHN